MLTTAASLFRRQGFAATGWRQVIAESGTPWGSQSHHFPGGKVELAVAALTRAGDGYEALIRHAFAVQHPAEAVRTWVQLAGDVLDSTDWADGCPVATVALERAHQDDAIREACHAALAGWQRAIAAGLEDAGAEHDRAVRLATLVLSSIEGALLLARVERSRQPLLDVGDQLATLLARELPVTTDLQLQRGAPS